MKKTIFLTSIFLLSFASISLAKDCGEDAKNKLKETYPGYSFSSVNPTPISGVCEVVSEKNTIYFAQKSGHLIFGEIWSKDGKNITAVLQEKRVEEILASLPLDKAVKIGSGAIPVIEITDPDCPFCRKGSDFFAVRNDVTRYIFFNPLDKLHPKAARKAEYILAAEEQGAAYKQIMAGIFDSKPLPIFTPNGMLAEHRRIAAKLQANSAPKYWINGHLVSGFNPKQFEKYLQDGQTLPDKK